MEVYRTFDIFYARFSNLVNSSYNLGYPCRRRKSYWKLLVSFPIRFKEKVISIETFYKPEELKINELIVYLQVIFDEGKIINLKYTKGSESKKGKNNSVAKDDTPYLDEEEMDYSSRNSPSSFVVRGTFLVELKEIAQVENTLYKERKRKTLMMKETCIRVRAM